MSTETRKDIESEIGKNGWRLVGKLAGVVLIPTIVLAAWIGAQGQTVADNKEDIDKLKTKMDVRSEAQAAILNELANINRQLSEMRAAPQRRIFP